MVFDPEYPYGEIAYEVPLYELNSSGSPPINAETIGGRQVSIPSKLMPDYEGTSDNMTLGRTESREWFFTKPVDGNYGRAGEGNILAGIVCNMADLNCPKIGVEDGKIYIEHLGDLTTPRQKEDLDWNSVNEPLLAKIIMADCDISGNIGYDGKEWYAFDFDRSGNPPASIEGNLIGFIQRNDCPYTIEELEEIASEAISELNLQELEERAREAIEANIHLGDAFNRMEIENLFEYWRNLGSQEAFTGEVEDLLEEIEPDSVRHQTDQMRDQMQNAFLD